MKRLSTNSISERSAADRPQRASTLCRQARFTLAEVLISLGLFTLLATLVTRTMLMGWSNMKEGHSQLAYQANARYGSESITRAVLNARSISIQQQGASLFVLNEDNTMRQFRYEDADDDPTTTENNAIWYNPDPGGDGQERLLVSNVRPLPDTPIFRPVGNGVGIAFHVGDPEDFARADHLSGSGYQGVSVRLVAKPRNVGHVWTLNHDL